MISCLPVHGLGEVGSGDDLAAALRDAADLRDGDILVVTSKVVSKAEGRVVRGDKAEALPRETDRVVATRGPVSIVRTHHGLVMAGAGIDASNTSPGTLVLLPVDPDASARSIREALAADGPNVGVLVSDTSGRAWRAGQTDIAIGAAGVTVLDDHAGRQDGYGNQLHVTAPAVADEVTAMAELATGKLGRAPAAVVRGLERFVLPRGIDGSGASALVRPEVEDMFGLGSREAVLQALLGADDRGFGAASTPEELAAALGRVVPGAQVHPTRGRVDVRLPDGAEDETGARTARAETLAHAFGWRRQEAEVLLRFVPATP